MDMISTKGSKWANILNLDVTKLLNEIYFVNHLRVKVVGNIIINVILKTVIPIPIRKIKQQFVMT